MKVREALTKLIQAKTAKGEVVHLTKIKVGTGKVEMTIGSGNGSGSGKRYAIWQYTKACRCGEVAIASDNAWELAQYLIDLCGRNFLKIELPLFAYVPGYRPPVLAPDVKAHLDRLIGAET